MPRKRVITPDSKQPKDQSLCWDCACSTRGETCPWANEFKPVDGWWAKPNTIWFMQTAADGTRHRVETESYTVIMCPLFKRDAWRGGLKKPYNAPSGGTLRGATTTDIRKLAAAIVYRAVLDWQRLDNGKIKKLSIAEGMTIKATELIEFFNSTYFEELLSEVSNRTATEVRDMLGVQTT